MRVIHPLLKQRPHICHAVLHMMTEKGSVSAEGRQSERDKWTLFNDFSLTPCSSAEARSFASWRFPCVLFFIHADKPSFWKNSSLAACLNATTRVKVPRSILMLPSLSAVPCLPALPLDSPISSPSPSSTSSSSVLKPRSAVNQSNDDLSIPSHTSRSSSTKRCELIAFDAEFVSVEVEKVVMDSGVEK